MGTMNRLVASPRALRWIARTAALAGVLHGAGSAWSAEVSVDRSQTFQTIEGFGFFGGADVWWSDAASVLDVEWSHQVIDDLGITIWRNEYYATATGSAPQDADWDKQRPVVQALTEYAAERHVPLKVLLTVWSPPAPLKCLADEGASVCNSDPPTRPSDTKNGNILDPAMRDDLAAWLVAGLDLYRDIGVDVYGLSFQNEPLFVEPYNSCVYQPASYAATLAAIGPTIKASYPDVKLFGSENMLGIECGAGPNGDEFDPYWYTDHILQSPEALSAIDAFAVHGYVDGVVASPTSKLATLWAAFRDGTASSAKPTWMTETSGYFHSWPGSSGEPGGLDLAQAIYAALTYGNLTAWAYWQGSEKTGATEYSLMAGTSPAKNYYVAKQYYRYIRPGARRVQAQSDDPGVLVTAFEHPSMGAFTLVAINTGSTTVPLALQGTDLPGQYQAFRTSDTEDCASLGTVAADTLELPASSITTLVDGNVFEDASGGGGAGAGGSSAGGAGAGGSSVGPGGAPSGNGAPSEDDAGCGCFVPGQHRSPSAWTLVTLGGAAALARTRRRRSGAARRISRT